MPIIPGFEGEYDSNGWPIFTVDTPELTAEQMSVFDYVMADYIADNPGIHGNMFASYLGIYFSPTGELSGEYVANTHPNHITYG
jgi:hypothetical protein